MSDAKRTFWINVLEKLNSSTDVFELIPDILKDLCEFFSFGCAFVYEGDHTATLYLRERYYVYDNHQIRHVLDLPQILGDSLYSEFMSLHSLVVKAGNYG